MKTEYRRPVFSTDDDVVSTIIHIVENNLRVLVYGDYDPDGAMSALCFKYLFDELGFENYHIYRYKHRVHTIDSNAIQEAITGGYEYFIVCDSGSAQPEESRRLAMMGIKMVILDHHQTPYDYSNFDAVMINTTIENRTRDDEVLMSAGALCAITCEKVLERLGNKSLPELSVLALISMYADSINMTTDFARGLYAKATDINPGRIPRIVTAFFGNWDGFNRRGIEYTFSPRISALFRAERFDLLNKYLFTEGKTYELADQIKDLHGLHIGEVNKAADIIERVQLKNFVVGDLRSAAADLKFSDKILPNYTGLVANKLADKYGKCAIVYCDSGVQIKGSLRDQFGRDFLSLFKNFSNCGGHNSAFGINIDYHEYEKFSSYLETLDRNYENSGVSNKPITVDHNRSEPDPELLQNIAFYNEFSGNGAPIALISKFYGEVWKETKYEYRRVYNWGSTYKVSSRMTLRLGNNVLIKPYIKRSGKTDISLDVKEVN